MKQVKTPSRHAWLRSKRLRWLLVLAVAGLGFGAWRLLNPPPPPPPPPSGKVQKADITQLVQAAGVLQAKTRVDVGAQVSGQIQTLHVQLGQLGFGPFGFGSGGGVASQQALLALPLTPGRLYVNLA